MGVQVVDYRVSTLVVLCKDCGQDVGLYPARHKCQPIDRPSMPALPDIYKKTDTSPTLSSSTGTHSKWQSLGTDTRNENEESIYYSNFAANLPETESNGKKLWGKVRQNEKWKQINEKNEKPKQTTKLWGKIVQATQTMADKIPNRDEHGPGKRIQNGRASLGQWYLFLFIDSDEDDWEGETHVSRIIRGYYEKKKLPLPEWLFDKDTQVQQRPSSRRPVDNTPKQSSGNSTPMRTPSRRRLWENDPDDSQRISNRERERLELRKKPSVQRKQAYAEEDRYSRDNRTNDHYREKDDFNEADYYRDSGHREDDRQRRYDMEDDRHRRYDMDDNDYRNTRDRTRERAPPSSRYDVDDYHYNRPSKPQRENTPSRTYKNDKNDDGERYNEVRSERTTRGFSNRLENSDARRSPYTPDTGKYSGDNNDLDDYHYEASSTRQHAVPTATRERARYTDVRRSPSRSGNRYDREPTYF
ncbi:hypothetical protein BDB01DRAFT_3641 [Pilobolus umbonatus]|nr:hypothetical protein BDB01DRAFT_3641 [Pilobolus umbonatus]